MSLRQSSSRDSESSTARANSTLSVFEFARRFCLHILPNRFVKIRHFGFLSNRDRTASIEAVRALLNDTGLQKEQDLRQQSADLSAGV